MDEPGSPFLEELKRRYDLLLDIRKTLENKALSMITFSGTIATLLFGFGYFVINSLGLNYQYLQYMTAFLVSGILLVIIAMLFALIATRIQDYTFVFHHKIFFDQFGQKKKDIIDRFYNEARVFQ